MIAGDNHDKKDRLMSNPRTKTNKIFCKKPKKDNIIT